MNQTLNSVFARILLACSLMLLASCSQDEQPAPVAEVPARFVLSYSAGEHGSIVGEARQVVTSGHDGREVSAVPAEGYHFTGWSDGLGTAERTERQVAGDLSVTAGFAINQYRLSYALAGRGRIEGPTSQTVEHGGDGREVRAVPEAGYHFTGWSDGLDTAERTERQVTSDLSATAGFAINQYRLSYALAGRGRIEGPTSQTIEHGGDGLEVRAVPEAGYHFTGWSDGLETPARKERNLTGDFSVTANFVINRYTLNYSAGPHGSIQGVPEQNVAHGESGLEVSAVAEPGYHFVHWSDGVTDPIREDSQVAGRLEVVAVFARNTYTLGGQVTGLKDGTSLILANNTGEELVIPANGAFSFSTSLFDSDRYEVTVLQQPTSPNQVCSVSSGAGQILAGNVTDVDVACELVKYSVGGKVSGLTGEQQIVLRNNAGDDLLIEENGAFEFAALLDDGTGYAVTLVNRPEMGGLTCDLTQASGTLAGANVTDIEVVCFIKPVLRAVPGIRKVVLSWNHEDFAEARFNICRSREDIPKESFRRCRRLDDGLMERGIESGHLVAGLTNDVPYRFRLEVRNPDRSAFYSDVIEVMPYGGLNDTGIDWCADDLRNLNVTGSPADKSRACDILKKGYPGQDGHRGRDAMAANREIDKQGQGPAGFDFTRVCRSGSAAGRGKCPPLPAAGDKANDWSCVLDNVTGLLWEIKSSKGLRAFDNSYSWFMPDQNAHGGSAGMKNAGECKAVSCDTQSYIQAVNEIGLCGKNDWRLPTKRELLSIVNNSKAEPAVDKRFFPYTANTYYWTSSAYAEQSDKAWQVYFKYGEASPDEKKQARHVRLVSGRTGTFGLENP